MSSVSRTKKIDPLSKKIPENPKYKHVRSGIDTGASMSKYMQKLEDIKNNYRFRQNEIFKRMKISTYVHLIIQVYQINEDEGFQFLPDSPTGETEDDFEDCSIRTPSVAPATEGGDSIPDTARSTLLSVARGVGELDLNQPPPAEPAALRDGLPYLLLDIRDSDAYDMCHIIGAINYPKSNLSKATNYDTQIMRTYRNKPGKIVIVYDEDERIAPYVAETLVQRGYDNLFMLSGGLRVACTVFPEGLITGTLPPAPGSKKGKQMDVVPATQKHFDVEDIDKLEMYLDTHLSDKSVGSRLSKASSRMSSTSSVASKQSTRSINSQFSERPAFR